MTFQFNKLQKFTQLNDCKDRIELGSYSTFNFAIIYFVNKLSESIFLFLLIFNEIIIAVFFIIA